MIHLKKFGRCALAGLFLLCLGLGSSSAQTPPPPEPTASTPDLTATLDVSELKEWESNPPEIQLLLKSALALTQQKLAYQYGSADPKNGGMDCSGTLYYLLRQTGVPDVPRQANEFYIWVRRKNLFRAVFSSSNDSFELDELKPGDLLFWTGTYDIKRDPPVTHVMIYLGRRISDHRRLMVGASEGRRYNGKSRSGVSVFDFQLPGFPLPAGDKGDGGRFIGYSSIPNLPKIPALTPALPPPISPVTP